VNYSIPYGKGEMRFDLPNGFILTEIKSKHISSLHDVNATIRDTLTNPINSPPLSNIAKGKKSACIVVTDITRNCPEKEILPHVVEILEKEIDRKNIRIIVGSGMHRKMTTDEKIEKYGKVIVENFQVIDHDSQDESKLVNLGNTKNGTPIKISKIAFESELLISIGLITLHQYAGYSGGYKTVSIGVASDETISSTHSLKTLKNTNARIGKIEGNPFQEDIIEIGKKVGLDFVINVIMGMENTPSEILAGEPTETHKALITRAKTIFEVSVKEPFDVVICGVGHPSDSNLYLASRAASFLSFGSNSSIKKGGFIIIPAKCNEGAGRGIAEQRFISMLSSKTPDEIINQKEEFNAGEQRAFVMANVLKQYHVIIVGCEFSEMLKNTGLISVKNMNEAFKIIKNNLGENVKIALIPNSMMTLPIINSKIN